MVSEDDGILNPRTVRMRPGCVISEHDGQSGMRIVFAAEVSNE